MNRLAFTWLAGCALLCACQPTNKKITINGTLTGVGDDTLLVQSVTLPPVKLLDSDFIDEARTRSFYESGRWTAADREAMYRRAADAMRRKGLSRANIRSAESNADAQFRSMLQAMSFNNIIIRFGDKQD